MKGFKDFVLRGNLIELAVAFIMAVAFTTVVTATVTMIMDVLGELGGTPDFSHYRPGGVHVGDFLTALVAFLILSAVVYFGIIVPYTLARERMNRGTSAEPSPVTEDVALLTEIRDLLAGRTADPPTEPGANPPR
ncbi:MAG: MscL family protein [Nocardioidaceae bacterium]|nr:MscL family protein [Nocardioidaceae bacterium]